MDGVDRRLQSIDDAVGIKDEYNALADQWTTALESFYAQHWKDFVSSTITADEITPTINTFITNDRIVSYLKQNASFALYLSTDILQRKQFSHYVTVELIGNVLTYDTRRSKDRIIAQSMVPKLAPSNADVMVNSLVDGPLATRMDNLVQECSSYLLEKLGETGMRREETLQPRETAKLIRADGNQVVTEIPKPVAPKRTALQPAIVMVPQPTVDPTVIIAAGSADERRSVANQILGIIGQSPLLLNILRKSGKMTLSEIDGIVAASEWLHSP